MAHYQTEEQQLEAIRDFFKQNQRFFMILVIVVLLVGAGYRYWQWHHTQVQTEASTTYDALMTAASRQDEKSLQAYADRLITSYPRTIYAKAAQLMLAKVFVQHEQLDKAKAALSAVMNSNTLPGVKQIARIRLARILMSQQQDDEALTVLKDRTDKSYESIVLELEGDIYLKQHQLAKAKEAFEHAMQLGKEKGMVNGVLEIKLVRLAKVEH